MIISFQFMNVINPYVCETVVAKQLLSFNNPVSVAENAR